MSAPEAPTSAPAFSPRAVLILVLVGLVAFSAMAVLSAYAPELRGGGDGRAHALSRSAVGYAGAVILLRELDIPVTVSRTRPARPSPAVTILTPELGESPADLRAYPKGQVTIIVLPKWITASDPLRRGYVRKVGVGPGGRAFQNLLSSYAPETVIERRAGVTRPVVRLTPANLAQRSAIRLGPIDRLQTISGTGWRPIIVDDQGRSVVAQSEKSPGIWVFADPDLLNNQGLADGGTAFAAANILGLARDGRAAVVFDVTLNGFERSPGLGRLALTPPWLAATLCAVAAALLMGLHALARFGPARRPERAIALGSTALVDNTAGLVRMARKEAGMAAAYAALARSRAAHAVGGRAAADDAALEDLARRRGAASPAELTAEAGEAKTPAEALAAARKLYDWRKEMMRGRV